MCPGIGEKGHIPPETFRSVFDVNNSNYIYQKPIDFICVFDLECNCSKNRSDLKFNETIELPVIIIDVRKQAIVGEFHIYVRPFLDSITEFCTELTGITRDMCCGKNEKGEFKSPTFKNALL